MPRTSEFGKQGDPLAGGLPPNDELPSASTAHEAELRQARDDRDQVVRANLELKKRVGEETDRADRAVALVRTYEADKAEALRNLRETETKVNEFQQKLVTAKDEIERLRVSLAEAQNLKLKAEEDKTSADKACESKEAERVKLAERLEQVLADKSDADRRLGEAVDARAAAEQEWKAALAAREQADKLKAEAEQALASARLEAQEAVDALEQRLRFKDGEIEQLHQRLLKALQ